MKKLPRLRQTFVTCGALAFLLHCCPSLAMRHRGLRKEMEKCEAVARLPSILQKGAILSRIERSKPQEMESSLLAAGGACLAKSGRNRKDRGTASDDGGRVRVRSRATSALKAGWNGSHFYIRRKGRFEIDPNGYFQFTYRGHAGPTAPNDDFVLRRAVLGARATIGRLYNFDISAEISDRKTPLHSAYLQIDYKPAFQLRLGRFKEPFSRQALVSSRYREFAERAMINNLAPGDGLGIMAQGGLFQRVLQYQAGIFVGKGILGAEDSISPNGVFRLRYTPWQRSPSRYLRRMTFGSAFADGRTNHGESFLGSTASGSLVFFAHQPVNGNVTRANGEWTWLIGPAGFHAEYSLSRQDRWGLSPERENLPSVIAGGYYLSGTYLVTGENRVEDAQPIPHHPVLGSGLKGLGAWELKFRYSTLHMSDGTETNQVDTLTPGLNWYLTHFIRVMIDLNVERLNRPVVLPVPRRAGLYLTALVTTQFRF